LYRSNSIYWFDADHELWLAWFHFADDPERHLGRC